MVAIITIIKVILAILIVVIIILTIRYGYYTEEDVLDSGDNGGGDVDDTEEERAESVESVERFYSKKGDSDYDSSETLESTISLSEASFYSLEESGIKRSKPEQLCKKILQRMFRRKFIRIKPSWLKNPETNYPLELDCYNEELSIALEYNGIQHYQWPNFTGQTKEAFEAQKRRDRFKMQRCRELGIRLIVIRYDVPLDQLEEEIFYQLSKRPD